MTILKKIQDFKIYNFKQNLRFIIFHSKSIKLHKIIYSVFKLRTGHD